jgi:predicted permease
MVLLIGSGLMMRSFVRILSVDPGFDSKHLLTARVGVSFELLKHDERFRAWQHMVARVSALPGVQSASAGWPLPMSSSTATISFNISGRPIARGDEPSESLGVAMPGYFETMRIPLVAGRTFDERDGLAGPPAIVVNQAFARKYFAGQSPLGQHIQVRLGDETFNSPVREVVGVVGDVRSRSLATAALPQFYLPYAQAVVTNPYMVVRTAFDPAAIERAVLSAIHEFDRTLPVYQVAPMDRYLSDSAAQPRFQAFLLTCFAGIGLALAAIGLYGLLSYTVVQRTSEIGLRMALGAQRSDVLGMIVRRGLTLALLGTAAGLIVSVGLVRLIAGLLFQTQPLDPLTFLLTSALLLLVGIAASSIPAFRAAFLDPTRTLRQQ